MLHVKPFLSLPTPRLATSSAVSSNSTQLLGLTATAGPTPSGGRPCTTNSLLRYGLQQVKGAQEPCALMGSVHTTVALSPIAHELSGMLIAQELFSSVTRRRRRVVRRAGVRRMSRSLNRTLMTHESLRATIN